MDYQPVGIEGSDQFCLEGTFAPRQAFTRIYEVPAMKHNVFKRLKDFQIGEPIWQPVIFAILIILISVTLYFIQQM